MFNHVTLLLDMAGCDKKCPMCWSFTSSKNKMLLDDLHLLYELFSTFTKSITISSWYKTPDIFLNYDELYSIENKVSDVIYPKRFEKINYNRLINEINYLEFIKKLNIKNVYFNVFGNQHTHNRYVGIQKDFENIQKATNVLIENNINVIISYIINKQNINEVKKTYELFSNSKVTFNLIQNIPSGNGYKKIYNRLTKQDLSKINFLNHSLGKEEKELYQELIKSSDFIQLDFSNPTFIIDGKYNIYFKLPFIDSNYYLGNYKIESIKQIIENYLSMNNRLLQIIKKYPIKDICKLCGNSLGNWIFTKEEYIVYLLEQLLIEQKYQNIS